MSLGNNIIGHKRILLPLQQVIYNKKFTHAHLFVGEDGIGKSIIANVLGKSILGCEDNIDHVDVIPWKLGKNKKSLGVGEIRILIEEINKKPYEGDNKVVIVYNADKMTMQAQNAFLKTIEEPPFGVYIFLLCENSESILDTIKSRCQIHKLNPLSFDEMKIFLQTNYKDLSENEMKLLISFSDGIPGKAEQLIYDENFKDMRSTILKFLKEVKHIDKVELLKYEEMFKKFNKENNEDIFDCMISFIRDAIIYKETGHKHNLINLDKFNELEDVWNIFSFSQLNDIIRILLETRENLGRNLNSSLVFSTMLLKIQEV
ncbi:hypothetical protein C3495_00705 [Clostridiaceae bacterium 14S0207]|nr:hypothetical protein C3495_00705 [Clostridiaceae bacterium 14S0207]